MTEPVTDRRLLAANARVAASELRGQVTAPRFTDGTWQRVRVPVADLLSAPGGPRDRQLLYGQRIRVFDIHEGHAFVQSERDGYVGHVAADALGTDGVVTHRVAVRATHLYPAPDLKRHELGWLSHGSLLTVTSHHGAWCRTDSGAHVPAAHLAPLDGPPADPVEVARGLLGTPYLWGGNSAAGIDCSGLVQAALVAAGHACPGDSDQQREALGEVLAEDVPPRPGDLYFWRGHVAMAVDGATLIHANAHHMAVASEPIRTALERIGAREFGQLLARKRLP